MPNSRLASLSACLSSGALRSPTATDDDGQLPLFSESLQEALRAIVIALGGAKVVGSQLWPEKGPVDGAKFLANCLDEDRREFLHPDQVLWLLREGRRVNCHIGMAFIASECGYQPPVAVEPDDEKAALQRQFIQAKAELALILARMEKLA